MEKRLYFCDCCGKELEHGDEFCTITLEGSVMVKRIWDNYLTIDSNREKRYTTLFVCNDCYESEKRKGSFIISQYESICAELAKKLEWHEEKRRKETGGVMEDTCNG